jgi:hypothetical protein
MHRWTNGAPPEAALSGGSLAGQTSATATSTRLSEYDPA